MTGMNHKLESTLAGVARLIAVVYPAADIVTLRRAAVGASGASAGGVRGAPKSPSEPSSPPRSRSPRRPP